MSKWKPEVGGMCCFEDFKNHPIEPACVDGEILYLGKEICIVLADKREHCVFIDRLKPPRTMRQITVENNVVSYVNECGEQGLDGVSLNKMRPLIKKWIENGSLLTRMKKPGE